MLCTYTLFKHTRSKKLKVLQKNEQKANDNSGKLSTIIAHAFCSCYRFWHIPQNKKVLKKSTTYSRQLITCVQKQLATLTLFSSLFTHLVSSSCSAHRFCPVLRAPRDLCLRGKCTVGRLMSRRCW